MTDIMREWNEALTAPKCQHGHLAPVCDLCKKDAEIAALQIKADLLDLAVRKGLLSVHSELIDPRNHGTRCSWLEGHAKACDISNNARAALKKAP